MTDSRKKRDAVTPVQSQKCLSLKKQKLTEVKYYYFVIMQQNVDEMFSSVNSSMGLTAYADIYTELQIYYM